MGDFRLFELPLQLVREIAINIEYRGRARKSTPSGKCEGARCMTLRTRTIDIETKSSPISVSLAVVLASKNLVYVAGTKAKSQYRLPLSPAVRSDV